MVKRMMFTARTEGGRVLLSYHDGQRSHQVAHVLPPRPEPDAQMRHDFLSLSLKEKHQQMAARLQPLIPGPEDRISKRLPLPYISKRFGVPVKYLRKVKLGFKPANRKRRPPLDIKTLRSMPEFQQAYLDRVAHLGVRQRALLLNEAYPEAPYWNGYYLMMAFRRLGIKYKKVRISRIIGREPH